MSILPILGLVLILLWILRYYLWRHLSRLSWTNRFVVLFDVVVGAVILIQFAQSNKWIPEQIPLPSLGISVIMVYLILLGLPVAIRNMPQLDFMRRNYDGRWERSGFHFRFIRSPPRDLVLTKAKWLDFEKSVRELASAKLPRTQSVLLDELSPKLSLICHEGNRWVKKTRGNIKELLSIIENNFYEENQSHYFDLLSKVVRKGDPEINDLVGLRFRGRIDRLWEANNHRKADLGLMTNALNTVLYLLHHNARCVGEITRCVIRDSSRVRFDALLSSLKEHGLSELKKSKTLGTLSEFVLEELSRSEEKGEHRAVARLEEMRKLLVQS